MPGSPWEEDVVDGCHEVVDGGRDGCGGGGGGRGVANVASR